MLKRLWKEFEHPAALFLSLVILVTFCWLVYVRCAGVTPPAAAPSASASASAVPAPTHVPEIPWLYDPEKWEPVTNLEALRGARWAGPGDSFADFFLGSEYRSIYPWWVKFEPLPAPDTRPGWITPITCGFFPTLQDDPKGVPTNAWRVAYCSGGEFEPGDGKHAVRLVVVREKRTGSIVVQVGNVQATQPLRRAGAVDGG